MNYLLDTNALLFFLENSPRLPTPIASIIENPDSKNFISLASLWEIAIKASLGKLKVDYANRPDLPELLKQQGFHILPLSWESIRRAAYLPFHHRDPFDRLIIAESQLKNIPILSSDKKLDDYAITRIW